jgi:hypothetical protein
MGEVAMKCSGLSLFSGILTVYLYPSFREPTTKQKLFYRRYNKQKRGCLVIYDGVVVYRGARGSVVG